MLLIAGLQSNTVFLGTKILLSSSQDGVDEGKKCGDVPRIHMKKSKCEKIISEIKPANAIRKKMVWDLAILYDEMTNGGEKKSAVQMEI